MLAVNAALDACDGPAMVWAGGCCVLSGAFYALVTACCDKKHTFAKRFEWAVRGVEACQASYMSYATLAHLLGPDAGAPIATAVIRRMAGYLVFDTAYEFAFPIARGDLRVDAGMVAHHVAGLVAHGLAPVHPVLRAVAPYVYLAEISTPFLHASWMLNTAGHGSSALFKLNGALGAAARVFQRPFFLFSRARVGDARVVRRFLAFRICLSPLILYWHRDPAPWRAEVGGEGVYNAFLGCMVVFIFLNFYWFKKLVKVITSKLGPKKAE